MRTNILHLTGEKRTDNKKLLQFLKVQIEYFKSIPLTCLCFLLFCQQQAGAQENPSCSVKIPSAQTLTCVLTSQYLVANYQLSGGYSSPVFTWTLNGDTIGSGLNNGTGADSILITLPGYYEFTIVDPFNDEASCLVTMTVVQDTTLPVIVTAADTITCTYPAVQLMASTTTTGATYNWAGPGNFMSTAQNPTVSAAGIYTVTVTNPVNSCSASASTDVSIDTSSPQIIASGGVIACGEDSVRIHAGSTTPGVVYVWSGPNEFASDSANPVVTDPGTYTVTIINLTSGCQSDTTVQVTENDSSTTSCSITSSPVQCGQPTNETDVIYLGYGPQKTTLNVQVTGTGPFTYSWQPATGLSCTDCAAPVFSPDSAGMYMFSVTVTSASGCTSQCSITICVLDIRVPYNYNRCGHYQQPEVYVCRKVQTCRGGWQDFTYTVYVWDVENYLRCYPDAHLGACSQHCGDEGGEQHVDLADINNPMQVSVYPNPFTSSFHFKIESRSDDPINVKLFDITGNMLSEQTNVITDEEQSFAGNVSNGVYFLQITQGESKQVIRIVKAN